MKLHFCLIWNAAMWLVGKTALKRRWANVEGQDFIANNQVQGIDFAGMHLWADNWLANLFDGPAAKLLGCKLDAFNSKHDTLLRAG